MTKNYFMFDLDLDEKVTLAKSTADHQIEVETGQLDGYRDMLYRDQDSDDAYEQSIAND